MVQGAVRTHDGHDLPAVLHALESAFAELHPYKVPELLTLSATSGLEKYVAWINAETSVALT